MKKDYKILKKYTKEEVLEAYMVNKSRTIPHSTYSNCYTFKVIIIYHPMLVDC